MRHLATPNLFQNQIKQKLGNDISAEFIEKAFSLLLLFEPKMTFFYDIFLAVSHAKISFLTVTYTTNKNIKVRRLESSIKKLWWRKEVSTTLREVI